MGQYWGSLLDRVLLVEFFPAREAAEHPDEVLVAIDDKTDALIRELEEQERQAQRDLRRRLARAW